MSDIFSVWTVLLSVPAHTNVSFIQSLKKAKDSSGLPFTQLEPSDIAVIESQTVGELLWLPFGMKDFRARNNGANRARTQKKKKHRQA